ncbi:hypothetical protein GQ54DRAFT_336519 [Martensiomyces pterosporus]|nr:hypothetical protein GQ54DRAFT_336519 [Martensiomyces pterosporus]
MIATLSSAGVVIEQFFEVAGMTRDSHRIDVGTKGSLDYTSVSLCAATLLVALSQTEA